MYLAPEEGGRSATFTCRSAMHEVGYCRNSHPNGRPTTTHPPKSPFLLRPFVFSSVHWAALCACFLFCIGTIAARLWEVLCVLVVPHLPGLTFPWALGRSLADCFALSFLFALRGRTAYTYSLSPSGSSSAGVVESHLVRLVPQLLHVVLDGRLDVRIRVAPAGIGHMCLSNSIGDMCIMIAYLV